MNAKDDLKFLRSLVSELRKLPTETQWVEFKENNDNPADIGEYLSALSNAAALEGKSNAYLVWGIEDGTHDVVGTNFKPGQTKGKGNEDLENWLVRKLAQDFTSGFTALSTKATPLSFWRFHEATQNPRSSTVSSM